MLLAKFGTVPSTDVSARIVLPFPGFPICRHINLEADDGVSWGR